MNTAAGVPVGWAQTALADACHVELGQSPPGSSYNAAGEGIPFLQGKAEFTAEYARPVKWTSAPNKTAQRDDILVSVRAPVGPTNLAPGLLCIGCGLAALRPHGGIEPRFVLYQLRALEDALAARATGSTFAAIDGSTLRTFPMLVAPTAEQRRVVAALEEELTKLDVAVAGLERAKANLGRYRSAILLSAVKGALSTRQVVSTRTLRRTRPITNGAANAESARLAAQESPRMWQIPSEWTWSSVDAIADVLLGRQRAPQYLTGGYSHPYLRVANVGDDTIDLSDLKTMDFDPAHLRKYRRQPGDILVSEGQSKELVGQSAIYRGGIEGLCFQKTLHRVRPIAGGPSAEFIQLVFRAYLHAGIFQRFASLTVNIAHLTLERLRAVPFPLPPVEVQRAIVERVSALLDAATRTHDQIEGDLQRAASLRQSILRVAFEGKLVPQDPNDEPASVLLQRIRDSGTAVDTKRRKRAHV